VVSTTVLTLLVSLSRYEVHHGVRISDGALVEAAAASDRYIAGKCSTSLCACNPCLPICRCLQGMQ
jgi:AAA lid domain